MTELWADFSTPPAHVTAHRPGAKNLKNAGFTGVIRYIGLGSEAKQIDADEYQDYLRNDMKVLLVAELGITNAFAAANDFATGQARAAAARRDARSIGIPDTVGIACAADQHLNGMQITDAVAYARGFASVLGKELTGFYGFGESTRAVHDADAVGWYWRTGSRPDETDAAWLTFYQRNNETREVNGFTCDINEKFRDVGPEEDEMNAEQMAEFRRAWRNERTGRGGKTHDQVEDDLWRRTAAIGATVNKVAAQLPALTAAVAAQHGIDQHQLSQLIDQAVAAHTPTAEQIAALATPAIAAAVHEVLGEDNDAQADDIVARIGQLLSTETTV